MGESWVLDRKLPAPYTATEIVWGDQAFLLGLNRSHRTAVSPQFCPQRIAQEGEDRAWVNQQSAEPTTAAVSFIAP